MQDGDKHMTIPCPACGANERKDIDWLANNDVLVCSGCGNGINAAGTGAR